MGIDLSRQGNGLRFAGVQHPYLLPPSCLAVVRSCHRRGGDPMRFARSLIQLMLGHFADDFHLATKSVLLDESDICQQFLPTHHSLHL
jgi:hypothetical protein